MAEWMFRIHNRVNGKLREQKLLEGGNPKWPEIRRRYEEWGKAPCSVQRMVGWDFLYSIANTTPSDSAHSTAMPGAPAVSTPALRNRWNLMTAAERRPSLEAWWGALGGVLPFAEWRSAWSTALKTHGEAPVCSGKRAMVAWLYRIERAICALLKEATPHNTFEGLCSELATFRSGCGTSKRSKTCRATKRAARKTLTRRRRSTYRLNRGVSLGSANRQSHGSSMRRS